MAHATVTIRRYDKQDELRCCEVVNSCALVMDGLNDSARSLIAEKNSRGELHAELSQLHTLVAEYSGVVVGLGALSGNEIKRLYIDPHKQGLGIGKTLMAALEAEALRHGYTEVVTESSPSAVSFYEQLGFRRLDEVSYCRGEAQFRCVKMLKNFETSGQSA